MLVSVIIPYYRSKNYIFKAVNSVIKQTYRNFELIIIDDENSSESKSLLIKIKKKSKKIKIFSTVKNVGAGFARNLGVEKSKGKFISFLDSDDYWHKNKLNKQILFIKKNNFDICYTGYTVFNKKKIIYRPKIPLLMNYRNLLNECPICCSSVVIKKEILNNFKFNNYKTKEDYDLWLRISKSNLIFFGLNEYLTFHRKRKNSLSSYQLSKLVCAFNIYKQHFKYKHFIIFLSIIKLYFNAFKKRLN